MPDVHLRAWREQKLYAFRDYRVRAETKEAAAQLLIVAQEEVDSEGHGISGYPGIRRVNSAGATFEGHVLPLDPRVVVDDECGVVEVSDDGEVLWEFGKDAATDLRNIIAKVLAAVDQYETQIHGRHRAPDGHDYVALWSIVQQLRGRPPDAVG
jgi:hypothetical protein